MSHKSRRQHVVLMHLSAITFTLQIAATLVCIGSGKLPLKWPFIQWTAPIELLMTKWLENYPQFCRQLIKMGTSHSQNDKFRQYFDIWRVKYPLMDSVYGNTGENICMCWALAAPSVSKQLYLGRDPRFSIKLKQQQCSAGCCTIMSCQTTQLFYFFLLVCGTALH